MDQNKVFSSLCYFSIFFAPFLFPIVMYFIVDNKEVKGHAKKSLLSHIIPFIAYIIIIGFLVGGAVIDTTGDVFFWVFISGMLIVGIMSVAIYIYNIVKGIKVLTN